MELMDSLKLTQLWVEYSEWVEQENKKILEPYKAQWELDLKQYEKETEEWRAKCKRIDELREESKKAAEVWNQSGLWNRLTTEKPRIKIFYKPMMPVFPYLFFPPTKEPTIEGFLNWWAEKQGVKNSKKEEIINPMDLFRGITEVEENGKA